jgi:hypothetical protein
MASGDRGALTLDLPPAAWSRLVAEGGDARDAVAGARGMRVVCDRQHAERLLAWFEDPARRGDLACAGAADRIRIALAEVGNTGGC